LSQEKSVVLVKLLTGGDAEHFKTIEVSYQNIPFEHEDSCHVLKLRDISHLQKLQEQQQKLEVIDAVTATVAHNMITPLKSISLLSRNIAQDMGFDNRKDAALVFSTSQLLLSEVMLLLDRNQLDKDRFQPNFTSLSVNDMIKTTVLLLQL
jgi:signal transduction histidine kinase